jgi:hypothetical protein
MRAIHFVGAAAALMLSAQPCLAADDFAAPGSTERRIGGFAGVSLRLPMNGRHSERASARLQLTTTQSYRQSGMQLRTSYAPGLELGRSSLGQPAFFMGGQPIAAREQRVHMGGTTTTLLIIGGVVLAVLVLAAVAGAQPTAGPPEGAFD